MFEYLLDKERNIKRVDQFWESIKDKPWFNDDLRKQIKTVYTQIANLYCRGKKTDANYYCDPYLERCVCYADQGEVRLYCQQKVEEFKKKYDSRSSRD